MAYVFSRASDSVAPDYGKIAQSGATVALNAEDPNIAAEIQKARDAGCKVAIWIPAHQDQDPVAYGKQMAGLVQYYRPDAILPNVEGAQGKASSGGSAWSSAMMGEFSRYVRPGSVRLDVVTEPGETDFDYKPYLNFGGGVVNESFTGDMKFKNPEEMRQKLIDAGVPEDRINMLLAPGQEYNGPGTFSAYTWDDMSPAQQNQFLTKYAATYGTSGGGAYQTNAPGSGGPGTDFAAPGYISPREAANRAMGIEPSVNEVPGADPRPERGLDSQNPAALRYSRMRLAELARQGITPALYGITGDPTAQWRALSAIVGAQQAIAAGDAGSYAIPANAPPEVRAVIEKMVANAQQDPKTDEFAQKPGVIAPTQPGTVGTAGAGNNEAAIQAIRAAALAALAKHQQPNPVAPARPAPRTMPVIQPGAARAAVTRPAVTQLQRPASIPPQGPSLQNIAEIARIRAAAAGTNNIRAI